MQRFNAVFVNGEFMETGKAIPSIDPSTGRVWAEVTIGDAATVNSAVEAARIAQRESWAVLPPWERSAVLCRLAQSIVDHRDELAVAESKDNGKPVVGVRDEIARGAEWLRFFAGAASTIYGNTIAVERDHEARTYRDPLGVIASITPWNSPLYLYLWKLAPALASGNTVVLKPSELASATSSLLARYACESGLPPGVLNIVAGEGPEVGRALASHADIDKLTFTGSVSTGRLVASLAANNFTPSTIEAGGKAPLVILDDANLDLAVAIAIRGAFRSAGQSCAQLSRIIVAEGVYAEFYEKFLQAATAISVGPATASETFMGPVISEAALRRCIEYVELARSEGYKVATGGEVAHVPGFEGGYYFQPTVIEGVRVDSALYQDEIFAPIVTLQSCASDSEALALANAVDFGLVAVVITEGLERSQRFMRDLDVGVVCVNSYRPGHWLLPYGGRKNSGMGIDNGYDVLAQYTQLKSVYLANSSFKS